MIPEKAAPAAGNHGRHRLPQPATRCGLTVAERPVPASRFVPSSPASLSTATKVAVLKFYSSSLGSVSRGFTLPSELETV